MTETVGTAGAPRRSSPLTALRRRWLLGLVVTLVGLLAGAAYGDRQGASYIAEARVAVGTGSLSAVAVAGYTVGVDDVAADYARSVTTQDAKTMLSSTLGAAAAGVTAANASPVPSSAVIRVDVAADSSGLALAAASAVTKNFISSINAAVGGTSAATVLQQYTAVVQQLLPLQDTQSSQRAALTRAQANGTTTAVADAEMAYNATSLQVSSLSTQASALSQKYQTLVSQPASENGLRSVQSAYLVGSNRHSLLERWGLIGLVLGALLALALATLVDARPLRRRRPRVANETPVGSTGRAGQARLVRPLAVPSEGISAASGDDLATADVGAGLGSRSASEPAREKSRSAPHAPPTRSPGRRKATRTPGAPAKPSD